MLHNIFYTPALKHALHLHQAVFLQDLVRSARLLDQFIVRKLISTLNSTLPEAVVDWDDLPDYSATIANNRKIKETITSLFL